MRIENDYNGDWKWLWKWLKICGEMIENVSYENWKWCDWNDWNNVIENENVSHGKWK